MVSVGLHFIHIARVDHLRSFLSLRDTSGGGHSCINICLIDVCISMDICKQFRHTPSNISTHPLSPEEMDDMWLQFTDHLAITGEEAMLSSTVVHGYLRWHFTISHPYLIPPEKGDPPRAPPVVPQQQHVEPITTLVTPATAVTKFPHIVVVCEKIAVKLQMMVDFCMVTLGTEAYTLTEEAL